MIKCRLMSKIVAFMIMAFRFQSFFVYLFFRAVSLRLVQDHQYLIIVHLCWSKDNVGTAIRILSEGCLHVLDTVDSRGQVMESLGVLQELREAGAVYGDIVLVADREIKLAEPPANVG